MSVDTVPPVRTTAQDGRPLSARTIERERRRLVEATTVKIKIPGFLLGYLALEAKIGPRPLTVAVARAIAWGEEQKFGTRVVRLPADDVEVILDGARTLIDRMAIHDDADTVARVRTLNTRFDSMILRVEQQNPDWTVTPGPDGYRVSRKASTQSARQSGAA